MIINDFMTLLNKHKVVIPAIQRDYAQGRENDEVKRIRANFLKNIMNVLIDEYVGKPLKLDFIYGYTEDDKTGDGTPVSRFVPLDGQQRLTTLFLIYWYVATYEGKMDIYQTVLSNFSYFTREKSRKFCQKLVEFRPNGDKKISSQIKNEPWFFISWESDPTVSSMLVMLDAIQEEFSARPSNLTNVWEKLSGPNPRIIFYLLKMEDLGLPEDLYIKMNSRGKLLTEFESFKARFPKLIPSDLSEEFKTKIDNKWADLFWNMHKNDEAGGDVARKVDSSFLNFYNYITDFLITTKGITVTKALEEKETYWLDKAASVYGSTEQDQEDQGKDNIENVKFLFKCLDLFIEQDSDDYFNRLFYIEKESYVREKVRLFFGNPQINLFHKCSMSYDSNKTSNLFSIGEQLMLYASILNLMEPVNNLAEKMRRLRNLIASSDDQMRIEYLKSHYKEVKNIFNDKPISDNARFSKHQITEEDSKTNFLSENPNLIDTINKLEDHYLLRGSISILPFDDSIVGYAPMFDKIFTEHKPDYLSISRAMMSLGDYSQKYSWKLRRVGNHNDSTWRELFTVSERRDGFDNTKSVLTKYLQYYIDNPETSNEQIIETAFTAYYPWNYYYKKYEYFQLGNDYWNDNDSQTEGFFSWEHFEDKPYECHMMSKIRSSGKHWNPFLLELSLIKKRKPRILEGDFGSDHLKLTYDKIILKMGMENDKFVFYVNNGDEHSENILTELCREKILQEEFYEHDEGNNLEDENRIKGVLMIRQNDEGYDLEDRIERCSDTLRRIDEFMADRTMLPQ